jgi:hypothetical protein
MANDDSILRFVINSILHIAILFTILGAFFIFYVSHIEEKSYQKEISSLINDALIPQLQSLDGTSKQTVQGLLQSLPLQSIQQSYADTAKWVAINNKWLKRVIWCIVFFLFLLLTGLLLLYYVRCRGRLNFGEVLLENVIIFILVGAIEIYFFINIAAKYIPVHPSLMTKVFITTLKEQVQ